MKDLKPSAPWRDHGSIHFTQKSVCSVSQGIASCAMYIEMEENRWSMHVSLRGKGSRYRKLNLIEIEADKRTVSR